MIGIYKIISPSNRVYIGQSINIEKRWKHHDTNCKNLIKLGRSFRKYGKENHKFEILQECKLEELDKLETYYKQLELNKVKGDWQQVLFCELYDTGGGPKSEETKKKISESNKGKLKPLGTGDKISKSKKGVKLNYKRTKEHNEKFILKKFKPVLQFDLEGNLIKKWDSIKEAEIFFNPLKSKSDNIGACCRKYRQESAYGFKWEYLKNGKTI